MKYCSIENCHIKVLAKQLCWKHYRMQNIKKSPNTMKRSDLEERFWSRVSISDFCWDWTGYISNNYGSITIKGRPVGAHRYSYEYFLGLIPHNMVIDHLCMNKRCVNPNHLEVVTNGENMRRYNDKEWYFDEDFEVMSN